MGELDPITLTDRAADVLGFLGYATDAADAAALAIAHRLSAEATEAVMIRSDLLKNKSSYNTDDVL